MRGEKRKLGKVMREQEKTSEEKRDLWRLEKQETGQLQEEKRLKTRVRRQEVEEDRSRRKERNEGTNM